MVAEGMSRRCDPVSRAKRLAELMPISGDYSISNGETLTAVRHFKTVDGWKEQRRTYRYPSLELMHVEDIVRAPFERS